MTTPLTSPTTMGITEPGVYDIPDYLYHQDPVEGGSLSSTGARRLLPPSCPAKFKWLIDHPEHKDIFDFGKAAHHAVLGVGPEIVVLDHDSWRTNAAKSDRDAARAAGLVPLLAEDADVVSEMAAAIRRHPKAGRLFQPGRGAAEQTLVWRSGEIMRRARLDWLQGPLIVDYKTTDRADDAACIRSMFTFGYHQQGDFYVDGATELGLIPDGGRARFLLVFQEKTAPYLVNVIEPDREALLWGGVLNDKANHVYRRCVESGEWPGYDRSDFITLAALPPYAITGYERARERGDYDTQGETLR